MIPFAIAAVNGDFDRCPQRAIDGDFIVEFIHFDRAGSAWVLVACVLTGELQELFASAPMKLMQIWAEMGQSLWLGTRDFQLADFQN